MILIPAGCRSLDETIVYPTRPVRRCPPRPVRWSQVYGAQCGCVGFRARVPIAASKSGASTPRPLRSTKMRTIVIGAGAVGNATAFYLHKRGHEVVVIERQPGAALETSLGN